MMKVKHYHVGWHGQNKLAKVRFVNSGPRIWLCATFLVRIHVRLGKPQSDIKMWLPQCAISFSCDCANVPLSKIDTHQVMIMCFSSESAEGWQGWKASPHGEEDGNTVWSSVGIRGGQADRYPDNWRTFKAGNKGIDQKLKCVYSFWMHTSLRHRRTSVITTMQLITFWRMCSQPIAYLQIRIICGCFTFYQNAK